MLWFRGLAAHTAHACGRSPVWMRWCCRRCESCVRALRRFPETLVWLLPCVYLVMLRSETHSKAFPHFRGTREGFSPVWILLCLLGRLWLKALPHTPHTWGPLPSMRPLVLQQVGSSAQSTSRTPRLVGALSPPGTAGRWATGALGLTAWPSGPAGLGLSRKLCSG